METKGLTAEEYQLAMEAAQRFALIEQRLLIAAEGEEGDKFLPPDDKEFLNERIAAADSLYEVHGGDEDVKAAIGRIRDALALVSEALRKRGDEEADRWGKDRDDENLIEAVADGVFLPNTVQPEYYANVLSIHYCGTRLDLIRGLPDVLEPLVRKYELSM